MADILYTYKNQVYANITNKCDCSCRFCIRSHKDHVGDSETLWHKQDPSLEEIKAAMDQFDFTGYTELVYCGYGEPTCALDNLIESAKYAKERYGVSIRVNTNGLANLYHKRDVITELAQVVDSVSIRLNAPTKEAYQDVTRPEFPDAFDSMLSFGVECQKAIPSVKFTVVGVLSDEEIKASQELADRLQVPLRVRKYS